MLPPKSFGRPDGRGTGTPEKMRRTVTFVERYQNLENGFFAVVFVKKSRILWAFDTESFFCVKAAVFVNLVPPVSGKGEFRRKDHVVIM